MVLAEDPDIQTKWEFHPVLVSIQPEQSAEFVQDYHNYEANGGKLHPKYLVEKATLSRLALRAKSTTNIVSRYSPTEFLVFLSQFTSSEWRSSRPSQNHYAPALTHCSVAVPS